MTVVGTLNTVARAQIATSPLPLSQRVLRANEFAGFTPSKLQTAKDVDAWVKIAPRALVNLAARLRAEGFVAALREDLQGQTNDRGALSIVVQVASPRLARIELARQLRDYSTESRRLPGHTYAPFAVPTIPAAHGFMGTDPNGGTGLNIIFSDGPFVYHVGTGWGAGAKGPPTRASVIAAVKGLYERVHGRR